MTNTSFIYCILFLGLLMGGKAQAQDWPNLTKYQNENANLKPAEAGQKRIVFIGDSITEFWTTSTSDFFKGKHYVNRGISGQTTPQILVRFRADVIALKPAAVVVLAGINDIAGNTGPSTLEMIADNIFSMAELAQSNQIKVILCTVLPAFDFPWNPNQHPAEKIAALNVLLKNYADANGIVLLDYYSAMVDQRKGMIASYSNDGVHPNKTGYAVMAPLAQAAINTILLQK